MTDMPTPSLAVDPAVPHRDRLLDADFVAGLLSRKLGRTGSVPVRSCRVESVSYRPGKRLRLVYRIGFDGRELNVSAATFKSSSRGRRAYGNALATTRGVGDVRPVIYDAGLETVFWTFPNDRRIHHLAAVAEAEVDLAGHLGAKWVKSRLVDYGPEVSAVVGCLDAANRLIAYAKVRAGNDGESEYRTQQALAGVARGSRLRIARPLAYMSQYRTLFVEPIFGTAVRGLADTGMLAGLRAYGAALATLHSLPADAVSADGRDALARLGDRAGGIGMVRPEMADDITALLGELRGLWDDAKGRPVPIHGDTNENNAILQDEGVTLIDFERACAGSAGSDIGNFLGLLRYYRSIGSISADAEQARASAFLRGYSEVRALPPRDALRVHESAALVCRAFRAVTRLRGSAVPHMARLLAEARGLLR